METQTSPMQMAAKNGTDDLETLCRLITSIIEQSETEIISMGDAVTISDLLKVCRASVLEIQQYHANHAAASHA